MLESIRRNKVAIKAPITTPVGSGFRSVNVALRKELDLYCCLRPCKAYEGVRTRFPETDIVIVRENHEDLYAGIEFEEGSEEAAKLRERAEGAVRHARSARTPASRSSRSRSTARRRIVRRGLRVRARERPPQGDRGAQGEHHEVLATASSCSTAQEVAKEYPDIEFEDRIIDNLCNQLVSRPEEYDVIVLPNLYGDIVSDLGAGMIGGLGMAPGGNIGDEYAVFEATHGSAPKYKGMNKVNPTALMLSGVMMLRHLGERRRRGPDGDARSPR